MFLELVRNNVISFLLIILWGLMQMTVTPAEAADERWRMKQNDVVFMYVPPNPELYDAYGANVVLWGGGAENLKAAHEHNVHFQSSIWFLTAWGKELAKDPALLESVCVDVTGKPIEVPWLTDHKQELPNYWGCTNAPYYREFIRLQARNALKGDFDGLHIDDHCGTAACASYAGGCFCPHCREDFREYLAANYSTEELHNMGVTNPATFDYLVMVRQYATTREEYQAQQWKMPLRMEFMNFQVRAQGKFLGEIRAMCELEQGRTLSFSANTGLPSPLHMGDYQHLDTLCGEIELQASGGKPSDVSHFAYKVADGLNRPLAATASGWDWAWIAEHNKPGLVKTWVVESYAHGNCLMAPHHQWCYTSEKGTHWWDGKTEDFAPLYKWVATHGELFNSYETAADVVLVFNTPAAYQGKEKGQEVAAWLASHNVSYRVAIAGGDWVDERLTKEDVASAKWVIVTTQDYLDEAQRELIAQLKAESRLIEWAGSQNAPANLGNSIEITGSENLRVTVRHNEQNGEAVVHVLNRDYDLAADIVRPTGPVTIKLSSDLLNSSFQHADAWSIPQESPQTVDLQNEANFINIRLPEINLWTIIHLRK